MSKRIIFLVIIAVAIFFRFYDLKNIPPGLYPDEAINGNDAIQALETGEYKVFYPENNGREGLFINIQAQSARLFGPTSPFGFRGTSNEPWMLRVVSAFFGTLTVIGLYFLTRRLFNWQIAAMASFLMAISFWHILFSRIGFRAIMAPFFLVWGLYFFWKGKTSTKLFDFALSGIFLGLGMHTYIAYRVTPLVVILVVLAYWRSLKKDFSHEKYLDTRNQLMRGFAMVMVAGILISLPLGWHYWQNPGDFFGRAEQLSVFSSGDPFGTLMVNAVKALGMFNFTGDYNWRHNISGRPLLFWPVGVLFVIGLIRSIVKLFKRKKVHGHYPTIQVMLLSWFFIGLLPVILSNEGMPHALRAMLVTPVVFIFAGEGLWWIYDFIRKWYGLRDAHEIALHGRSVRENNAVAVFAVLALLFGFTIGEYDAYFRQWAKNPEVPPAFETKSVELGEILNSMPISRKKYIVVNADGVLVNNIPMQAQTVMFITDTWSHAKQKAKNIFYLTEEQFRSGQYDKDSAVFKLN